MSTVIVSKVSSSSPLPFSYSLNESEKRRAPRESEREAEKVREKTAYSLPKEVLL